ncbi:MAG: virulence-associated protein E [Clostridia bacterium]|nr:virulence-associated protein E [Clostridia bacterium]
MNNERVFVISTGNSRKDRNWKSQTYSIPQFFDLLRVPQKGAETLAEYMRLPKTQQDDLKDVGGFVGGTLSGKQRKASAVTGRCMVTLDFDNVPAGMTDEVIRRVDALGVCYCVYSTRKHRPEAPRLRIVFPADRIMAPDEHEPVARRMAAKIGIEYADPTTFEINRLMFFPSVSSDGEFVYRDNREAPCFSVDGTLAEYADWHDMHSWPTVPGTSIDKPLKASKQADPETKTGLIGAFCKHYDVFRAMDELLPGVYQQTDTDPNRYTYTGGSTTGGAVVYDNGKFLYSHHATDPCSGKLVNTFDLVRLHKFGELDENSADDTPVNRLPSTLAMLDYLNTLPEVIEEHNRQRWEEAQQDFAGITASDSSDTDISWMLLLKASPNGGYLSTIENFSIALEHDPTLKGRIWRDEFAERTYGMAPLPWGNRVKEISGPGDKLFIWDDADDAGLRKYFEKLLHLDNKGKLEAALTEHLARHSKNPVRDYLIGAKWDGKPRLDTLFIDYLGAEDTPYTRAVTRKAFTAAVSRVFSPGRKFDNMLILCGPQGLGKSTILSLMADAPPCKGLFNESIRTFEGKEAAELLQGVWIVEIAELNAFRGSDVDRIKQFLSLCSDTYRAAYAHRTAQRPRRCVFFGTCNTFDFLRDPTGNRRFWPVDVASSGWTEEKQRKLIAERDQIWAEARMRFVTGEALYLSGEVESYAKQKQEAHMENNPLEGSIIEFLDRPIPADWDNYSLDMRLTFWGGGLRDGGKVQLVQREKVCAMEILRELMGVPLNAVIDKRRSAEVNSILQHLGWNRIGTPRKFGPHGPQKGYYRPR